MKSTCEDLFLQISVVIFHVLICCLKLLKGGYVERNPVGVAKEQTYRQECCSSGHFHPLYVSHFGMKE